MWNFWRAIGGGGVSVRRLNTHAVSRLSVLDCRGPGVVRVGGGMDAQTRGREMGWNGYLLQCGLGENECLLLRLLLLL